MNTIEHGISVAIEQADVDFFLSLKAVGKLTHDDYKSITPKLNSALNEVNLPNVNVLFDCTELKGWELRAAWDDFKLSLEHRTDFDKVAIYGNKDWQEISAKIGSWFITGQVKYFKNKAKALTWLNA